MTTLPIVGQALHTRRRGLVGWAAGLAAAIGLVVVSYPAVRGQHGIDQALAKIPPSVQQLLGLGKAGISSPVGYLNSQLVTNLLPVLLLVFGVSMAGWSIAGDEASGTLELVLSTPVGRGRLAAERALALVVAMAGLTVGTGILLMALAPTVRLTRGLPPARLMSACAAAGLAALVFAAIAFVVGAATGSRTSAVASASGVAAGGYLVEGLAHSVTALRPVADALPWHWLIAGSPLVNGTTWENSALPAALGLALLGLGVLLFRRRDLH
jgi:ABC-2 type transport system permease protein